METLRRIGNTRLTRDVTSALPTIEQVRAAVRGKSQEDVAATAKRALEGVDQQRLKDFGQMLQENLAKRGIKAPPGVSQGNVTEIAGLLAGLVKGGAGADVRQVIQNSAVQDSAKGMVLARLATSRLGLLSLLLRDPRGLAVVGPVFKALVRGK